MKRMVAILWVAVALSLLLTGCMGRLLDVTVVVKNATDEEIRWVVFNIPQSSGSYSPMKDIITDEDKPLQPGEEREIVISLVQSDFGNAGIALIGLTEQGDSDALEEARGEVVLERKINYFTIRREGEQFAIAADEGINGLGDNAVEEARLLLIADFAAGSAEGETKTKEITLPQMEDMPASNAVVAFFLADSLSEWTGLDFTLNDVRFDNEGVLVDWAADSTLIAGLDEREQKAEFHFLDAVGLNWFMMDSLAQTLKYNLPVSAVYYQTDGGPILFQNREDMAVAGLPELPVNQPYEGSVFYTAHMGGQG